MQRIAKISNFIANALFALVLVSILFSMLVGTYDAFSIRVLSRTVPGAVEITTNLIPIIVFGSLAAVQLNGGHIRVEIIYDRVSARAKAFLDLLNSLVVTISAGTLAYFSWQAFLRSNRIKESGAAFPFPLYPIKGWVAIGFAAMMLTIAVEGLLLLQRYHRREVARSGVDFET